MNKIASIVVMGFAMALASCESVFDDRSDCVSGVQLRFVYDYHMEPGANSFPANVDCVSVLVFDKEGNYVTQFSETSSDLQNESYRMVLPLAEGDYHLMVYGGLACENASFTWNGARSDADDIVVELPLDENGVSAKPLHDIANRTGGLFYGTLDLSVTNDDYGTTYTEHTVNLMKDTNTITITLQELSSPTEVDYTEYNFSIVDDNFRLDSENKPIHIATDGFQPLYKPYAGENRVIGYVDPGQRDGTPVQEDTSKPVQVGTVEFATSRLFVDHASTARLVVTSNRETDSQGNPREIINVPLISYLLAAKGFGLGWIRSDQEYLDRQSNWNLMFFLNDGKWVSTTIAVNNWIVRLVDIELDI